MHKPWLTKFCKIGLAATHTAVEARNRPLIVNAQNFIVMIWNENDSHVERRRPHYIFRQRKAEPTEYSASVELF
jgi:hypothetical protein